MGLEPTAAGVTGRAGGDAHHRAGAIPPGPTPVRRGHDPAGELGQAASMSPLRDRANPLSACTGPR